MRLAIFLLLFSTCCGFMAQTNSLEIKPNQVKLSPVRLFTAVPGIQLSYERQLSKKFSLQLTGAYLKTLIQTPGSHVSHLSGYLAGLEQKYFFKTEAHTRQYVSADLSFLNAQLNLSDSFHYTLPTDSFPTHFSDTVALRRMTCTLSLKYGLQFFLHRVVVDLSIGVGLRYRNVSYSSQLYPGAELDKHRELSIFDELFCSGRYFTFNLPLGLKVGYNF